MDSKVEIVKERKKKGECISCGDKLNEGYPQFTGTDNYHKGHYLTYHYCDNAGCVRYKLALNLHTIEKK
jgi:hypothetical protein